MKFIFNEETIQKIKEKMAQNIYTEEEKKILD